MSKSDDILLEIQNLSVNFYMDEGVVKAVNGVSFSLTRGKTTAVIGESGCGKSVTAHSIMRIVPSPPGRIVGGSILFYSADLAEGSEPIDLTSLNPKGREIRSIRGKDISMIFQEPMTSFSPLHTIGSQIVENILLHSRDVSKAAAREHTIDLLRRVGMPMAEKRLDAYPHQFSGGMRQRAMIAMALSCSPQLLLADEPTTALDVTIQAQILDLLSSLQAETGMTIMLITHNLAIVADVASDIIVMYRGRGVEYGSTEQAFENPLHPYTQGLLRSIPKLSGELTRLVPIPGVVPGPYEDLSGCAFYPRCDRRIEGLCNGSDPPPSVEVEPKHFVSCFLYV